METTSAPPEDLEKSDSSNERKSSVLQAGKTRRDSVESLDKGPEEAELPGYGFTEVIVIRMFYIPVISNLAKTFP